jgi:hypothetical protein
MMMIQEKTRTATSGYLALEQLADQGVVELDEERKASMVSNLLIVLCGEENARPVLNAGSLYS